MIPALKRTSRFVALSLLATLGAILFVPFLAADAPAPMPRAAQLAFVLAASAVAVVATWFGLGWCDRAGLPMPVLRALDGASGPRSWRLPLVWGLVAGAAVGASALVVLRAIHAPPSAASLGVRLGSALFAAVTLEAVLHLAIMSGVVAVTQKISWGIAAATVAYVLFHLSTLGGQPTAVVLTATFGNAFAGVMFGVLFARFGYESLVVAHLVAHAIAVGFS